MSDFQHDEQSSCAGSVWANLALLVVPLLVWFLLGVQTSKSLYGWCQKNRIQKPKPNEESDVLGHTVPPPIQPRSQIPIYQPTNRPTSGPDRFNMGIGSLLVNMSDVRGNWTRISETAVLCGNCFEIDQRTVSFSCCWTHSSNGMSRLRIWPLMSTRVDVDKWGEAEEVCLVSS